MMRLARLSAEKSPFLRYKLGAVIVKGGRELSTGYNEIRYTKELRNSTLHAEEAAIVKLLKARRQNELVGSDLFVTRIRSNGTSGCSRPCARCSSLIRSVGIRRVFFTTEMGEVDCY